MKMFLDMKTKQKQLLLFWGILGLASLIGFFILSSLLDEGPIRQRGEKVQKTDITTVGQRISPQEVWG